MNIAVHRNGRGAMRMIKLTKAHEIAPVLWVHSDDDGSDYRVRGHQRISRRLMSTGPAISPGLRPKWHIATIVDRLAAALR